MIERIFAKIDGSLFFFFQHFSPFVTLISKYLTIVLIALEVNLDLFGTQLINKLINTILFNLICL